MRILVSLLNFRPGRIGGTETYLREVLPRLPAASPGDDFFLLAAHDLNMDLEWPGYTTVRIAASQQQIYRDRILEAFTPYRAYYAEEAIRRLRPDVVFFPQQSLFPKRVQARVALTVVDIQHITNPRNVSLSDHLFRRAIYPYSIRRANRVLSISEYVKGTLVSCLGTPEKKVDVTLLGLEARNHSPSTDIGNPQPFLYYPAASYPHKNHISLFHTIADLRRNNGFRFRVVLTGIQTAYWKRINREIVKLGLADIVSHLGYVDHATVHSLYSSCAAVLFPSLHEGFGLPVAEAVSHQKKIIVSMLSIYDELGVPKQCQIDFSSPSQLRESLECLKPTRLTKPLPSWEQCAELTARSLRSTAYS